MDKLDQLEVFQPCPGCGQADHLAVHSERISYLKNQFKHWIGCSCGWRGPMDDHPVQAAAAWDLRE